ncbi:hypothetical protein CHS0354_012373 [Potamilus streckersoni]|uniref:14-3-3 domain-containing protein n=1 Tax=Potamilus streckersoni TaxID=2493646 RepID=A0AAE0VWJ9_9BIVA|nr:hypothetical protein CHS0354_012373 [Potamilus streckersoni]
MADDEKRSLLVNKAKLSETCERYQDMVENMRELGQKAKTALTADERNLLSVAYKNVVGARRSSWRIVSSLSDRENDQKKKSKIQEYRKKIEDELNGLCDEVLSLLDHHLIAKCDDVTEKEKTEAKIFFLKMKGDYYRYKVEVANEDAKEALARKSEEAYEEAYKVAEANLKPTNPIRLGLALNFSVYYYEIQNNQEKACKLAKDAFDAAVEQLETLQDGDSYKDSTLIMQLLRDNLTLWTAEVEDGQQEDN